MFNKLQPRLGIQAKRKPLPYRYFQTVINDGRPDILFHWHPELELTYVQEGTARYHIDNDFFNGETGDIILVRPNGMHSIHPINGETHVIETFQFHLDMIGSSVGDQVTNRYLQPLQDSTYKFLPCIKPNMPGYDALKDCLFLIFSLSKEEERHFELLLKAKLHEFLYLLYYHRYVIRKYTDDIHRKNEKIRELVAYINNNYHQSLTVDFLADFIGYSKTHFMAIFKQHTGSSCTEFIIQVRLNKACELLVNSSKPIVEIANGIGFNNLSNFNRQFKQYYDMTPSHYRKQYTKTKESCSLISSNISNN